MTGRRRPRRRAGTARPNPDRCPASSPAARRRRPLPVDRPAFVASRPRIARRSNWRRFPPVGSPSVPASDGEGDVERAAFQAATIPAGWVAERSNARRTGAGVAARGSRAAPRGSRAAPRGSHTSPGSSRARARITHRPWIARRSNWWRFPPVGSPGVPASDGEGDVERAAFQAATIPARWVAERSNAPEVARPSDPTRARWHGRAIQPRAGPGGWTRRATGPLVASRRTSIDPRGVAPRPRPAPRATGAPPNDQHRRAAQGRRHRA
jgi:hypothetical protein